MATTEQQNARHRQLVAGYYATGSEAQLSTLLSELRPLAVRYARHTLRLRDGERAEDLAQDVLLHLLLYLRAQRFNLEREGSLLGLVYLCCRQQHVQNLGRRRDLPAQPGAAEDPFLLLGKLAAQPAEERTLSLEYAAQAGATVAAATQAVLGLDPNARAAVVLHFYQGLPTAQAAARLGVDERLYRERLSRGLTLLQAWGQSYPHPSGEVYASLPSLHTGDLFTEPLRLAS